MARLLTVAADDDPEFLLYVRLAAVTGARRGELCGLRWTDLTLDAGELTINRSIALGRNGPVERERGKTASSQRSLSLDSETVAALAEHGTAMLDRADACDTTLATTAFVFSNLADGNEPWRPDAVTHRFGRLRDRAGLMASACTISATSWRRRSLPTAWTSARWPSASATPRRTPRSASMPTSFGLETGAPLQ